MWAKNAARLKGLTQVGNATILVSESTGTATSVGRVALLRAGIIAGVALRLTDRGLRLIRP